MGYFSPSIFAVLTQPGPEIAPINGDVSTYQPGTGCKVVKEITDWDDLTATNILNANGDILDQKHAGQPTLAASIRINNIEMVTNVKQMEADFLHHLLENPLAQGCGIIAPRLASSDTIQSARIGIYRDFPLGQARPSTAFLWDKQLLVVSAAKRDADWDFTNWKTDRDHPTAQLAWYATSAHTRYTYIVTEAEIVFCQFYYLANTNEQLGVRRKVVPLDGSGSDTLTPGLALWAVAMMALNERHRGIVNHNETARLNEWIPLFNYENRAVYKNVLSAREKRDLPEGGVTWLPPMSQCSRRLA